MKETVFYITLSKNYYPGDIFTNKLKILTPPHKTIKGWEYLVEYINETY